jgi:hypothetical protein
MRTNFKTKNFLTYLLFAIIIGCQDTNVISKKKASFIETIKVEDDKELQKMISDLNKGTASSNGRTLTTNFGEVKFDEAVKLNDTIYSRTRYSLWINRKTDSLIFENLVIVNRKEGVFQYILQYLPDPDWYKLNYKANDWSNFTGKVRQLTPERKLAIEVQMKNGQNTGDPKKGGRIQECCSFTVGRITTTGGQFMDIDCRSGYQALLFTRTTDCGSGGGGGDPTGGGSSGPSAGGGGSSGTGGSQDSGGGGGAGSGNSNNNSYTNPIGIYTPRPGQQHGIADDEPWPGSDLNYPYMWWENDAWLDANFQVDPYDQYKKLTQAEKDLVKQYPEEALKIRKNRDLATQKTIAQYEENGHNNKSDAFRHAYFQGLNTYSVGAELTKLFSDAHESETPTSLNLEKQMDLYNNGKGIGYGSNCPCDVELLVYYVIEGIAKGELKYLSPLDANNLIIPNVTQLIPTNQ